MEDNKVEFKFYHKDEFGQEFSTHTVLTDVEENNIITQLEQFKLFLLYMSYPKETVDKITYNKE